MTQASTDPLVRETPAWFDEAKLGVFIHWCPAAVPAFAPLSRHEEFAIMSDDPDGIHMAWRRLPHAAMYQNALEIEGSPTARHHAETYGDRPYDAFAAQFREESIPACDPEAWAELAARSGARYVVMTTKLPDGFLLWPSAHRNPRKEGWQAERDVIGELAAAVRDRELRFATYYCAGVDWTFDALPITSNEEMVNAVPGGSEYAAYAEAHWREIIDRYEPSVLWNDFTYPDAGSPAGQEKVRELFRSYLQRVPDGVINNRFQERADQNDYPCPIYSDFVTPEYSIEGTPELKWESCRAIGTSFGFNRQESEETYLQADELIHMFIDVVARGGNLLININPTATGEIPTGEAQRMLALGWWLSVNGDAIYATRPWERTSGFTVDGQGVRYTATEDAVYGIVLGTPPTAAVELDVHLEDGAEVSLVGTNTTLPWTESPAGTRIDLLEPPDRRPAVAVRMAPRAAVRPTGA